MKLKHVIKAQQFSREWLEREFFPQVERMGRLAETNVCHDLTGKKMISLFYQPSTRTRMSFEIAMKQLGGDVVFSTENARQFSSVAKGESLKDTIRVINRYRPDVIVLRYDQEGGAETAAEVSAVPIINAGDGPGQHPTQALLDVYTIFKKLGRLDDISIAMIGDLKRGRTVRSLVYLLSKFSNVRFYFVAANEQNRMRPDILDHLREKGNDFTETEKLQEVAAKVDVIYQTRAQTEHGSADDFLIIDRQLTSLMKPTTIIMHPLPRREELAEEVDDDPRAVYLTEQIENGLYVRMALLKAILV